MNVRRVVSRILILGAAGAASACALIAGLEDRTLVDEPSADVGTIEGGGDAAGGSDADATTPTVDAAQCMTFRSATPTFINPVVPEIFGNFGDRVGLYQEDLFVGGRADGSVRVWHFTHDDGGWLNTGPTLSPGSLLGITVDENRLVIVHNDGRATVMTRADGTVEGVVGEDVGGFVGVATVALSGDRLALAVAPSTDAGAAGSAAVYGRSDGGWMREAPLLPGDGGTSIRSHGATVALAADWVFVGAPHEGDGRVRAYRRGAAADWTFHSVLEPQSAGKPAEFGGSILIRGNALLVGAPGVSEVSDFEWNGSEWKLRTTIRFPGLVEQDRFGDALGTLGDLLVVAGRTPQATSFAQLFCRTDKEWASAGPPVSVSGDFAPFGPAFAASEGRVALGLPLSLTDGAFPSGKVAIFE